MQLNPDKLRILAVQFCICAILLLACLLYWSLHLQPDSLIYPACLFLVALTIWIYWSWYVLNKTLFDPYTLFFTSAVLFNGGQAFLEVFHLNQDGILDGVFSSKTLLETLFLVILGLASFHLGALLSAVTHKVSSLKQSSRGNAFLQIIQENCRKVGWGLLSISFLPTVLVLKDAIVVVLSSGYAALYQQEKITSFNATPQVLSSFLIPATLFLLAGSKERRNGRVVSIVTVFLYAGAYFFLGQRNQAVMPLLAFAWLWHYWIHPISKTLILSITLPIVFIVFPLIQSTRNVAGADRLSISFLVDAFSSIDNPFITSISEMGGSMQTVAYTIELVPKVKDFEMGVGYLYALLTFIPNLFWKIHPTIARGIPDGWLVWEVNPSFAASDGTIGFSFIAEAYLNFGWVGTPIALGVIGFLLAKLILWGMKSDDPAKMAMVASFISFFLFYPRGAAAYTIRSLVWYSLIPYIGVCILNSQRTKHFLK